MDHLRDHNISYINHMIRAFYYSFLSFKACVYFLIHGIFPSLFDYYGSDTIDHLASCLIHSRNQLLLDHMEGRIPIKPHNNVISMQLFQGMT